MRYLLLAAAFFSLAAPPALAQGVPADLNTWSQKGPTSAGSWAVSEDGTSVLQTVNQNQTFFVSPNDFFNTTVTGTFTQEQAGGFNDDDYLGFVFGYQTPQGTGSDYDFLLLSWKQGDQSGDLAGFSLADVACTGCLGFGQYQTDRDASGYDLLGTDVGPGRGWVDNVTYSFRLRYTSDSLRVDIAGGVFGAGETIFELDAADAGLASFPNGPFGFFNHSQANVRYSGFTQNNPPVAEADDVVATEGQPETFNVLANDSDPDGDAVSIESFTFPAGGTLTQEGDSSFTYTPSVGTLSDSFTYTITDGALTSTATVSVSVEPSDEGGVTLTVADVSDPVVAGQRVTFDLSVVNGSSGDVAGVGALVTDPNGRTLRQRLNLYGGTIAPGESFSSPRSKRIPAGAVLGTYTADIQAVSPSGDVLASQTITFEVISGAGLRVAEPLAAFPNPAVSRATLRFGLAEEAVVRLAIYDALGREVAVLLDGPAGAGIAEHAVEAAALPAGLYVARLVSAERTETVRFSIVR